MIYPGIDPSLVSTYTDPIDNHNTFTVPGIIVNVGRSVMRTEGVIVDALLGRGEALDDYSKGLQAAAITQRNLANDQQQAENDKAQLAIAIVKAKDADEANVFAQVYPPPREEPEIELTASGDGQPASKTPASAA
jgi:hypothetical protein